MLHRQVTEDRGELSPAARVNRQRHAGVVGGGAAGNGVGRKVARDVGDGDQAARGQRRGELGHDRRGAVGVGQEMQHGEGQDRDRAAEVQHGGGAVQQIGRLAEVGVDAAAGRRTRHGSEQGPAVGGDQRVVVGVDGPAGRADPLRGLVGGAWAGSPAPMSRNWRMPTALAAYRTTRWPKARLARAPASTSGRSRITSRAASRSAG
ncbi:MAG: hypothetical protein ABJB47_18205 [Actinomycetota bacterium]